MRPGITLTAGELAAVVGGELAGDVARHETITLGPQQVTIHSAHVEPGAVFVALTGRRDGHDFVAAAVANKAVAAIVARRWPSPDPALPLVRVDDPLAALQRLAAWYRARLTAHVVAVVGSLGKTTTKDALVSFLGESAYCYGSPGSFNSQLGVPLSVLWCPADADIAVFEVATTEPGELDRLVDVVRPDTLVVTTVGDRFRRSFGSAAAYAAELGTLARVADRVVCGDDGIQVLAGLPPGTVTALTPATPAWPVQDVSRPAHGSVTITLDGQRIEVPTSSSWVAGDVALAAATSVALGHRPTATTYAPTSVDLQTWRSPAGVYVLRSAAVDEPMAWRTALADAFDAVSGSGRVVVVLSETAHEMSEETLTTLAAVTTDRPWSVLVTAGRAADVLGRRPEVPLQVHPTPSALSAALAREAVAGDVVSVITARGELIEGISRDLFEAMAPIKLRIDVGAMALNVAAIRRQCPGAMVMAVVKAGAYGADAPELARHLAACGVDQFAVSHADEGVQLRRSGVTAPVLVLLATPDELRKARRAHLTICVHSPELLRAVLADPAGVVDVHVEVDTGLHRTGLAPADVVRALEDLRDAGVTVSGLMTHLSSPDDPDLDHLTIGQLATFDDVVDAARAAGLAIPVRHALASGGVCRFPSHAMEMVRVGLALHGIAPSPACAAELALVPSLTLTSRLIDRRVLAPGEHVGYGATFEADRPIVTGVVQLGYHDGIFRSFQDGGAVIVDGRRCPVVGRISMDSTVVDLSACPDAAVGTDVLLFGTEGDSSQPIEDVAAAMGTIPYEVVARLGPRVQRVFVRH
jgi:alanine racemase